MIVLLASVLFGADVMAAEVEELVFVDTAVEDELLLLFVVTTMMAEVADDVELLGEDVGDELVVFTGVVTFADLDDEDVVDEEDEVVEFTDVGRTLVELADVDRVVVELVNDDVVVIMEVRLEGAEVDDKEEEEVVEEEVRFRLVTVVDVLVEPETGIIAVVLIAAVDDGRLDDVFVGAAVLLTADVVFAVVLAAITGAKHVMLTDLDATGTTIAAPLKIWCSFTKKE